MLNIIEGLNNVPYTFLLWNWGSQETYIFSESNK